jgi:hypothetical protein
MKPCVHIQSINTITSTIVGGIVILSVIIIFPQFQIAFVKQHQIPALMPLITNKIKHDNNGKFDINTIFVTYINEPKYFNFFILFNIK